MWTKSRSLQLSRIITVIFFILLVIGTTTLPKLLKWYISYTGKPLSSYELFLITFWCSFIPAFLALFCLMKLLNNIAKQKVFVSKNLSYIRLLSWCCFIISAIFAIFSFYYYIGVLVVFFASFIGLILRVIKNIFAQAMEIKSENDLTV